MTTLRAKAAQMPLSVKLVLSLSSLFLLVVIVRSNFSTTPSSTSISLSQHHGQKVNTACPKSECSKAPSPMAWALIHYATTRVTPQQTFKEISVSMRVLEKKSPCNFLVFGLGHDSLLWANLNHGGRTVFLEEDSTWIEQMTTRFPSLVSYHVTYDTKVKDADALLSQHGGTAPCTKVTNPRTSECQLALKNLPEEIYNTEWDMIMVDAPTGYKDDAPGRMNAIFTAGLLARNREFGDIDVFVHDVDRPIEDKFSRAFLCDGYLIEQENRLRHFVVPSHKSSKATPFCPN